MRFSAILSVFFLGFGTILVFQEQHVQAQYGAQQGTGQRQPGVGVPAGGGRGGQPPAAGQGDQPVRPWQRPAVAPGTQPVRPGQPPVAAPGTQPIRPGQPPAGQGNQPVRLGQPPVAGQGNQPVRPGQPPVPAVERLQRPQPQPVGPLVRPFGETRTAETPVTGFGQRVAPQGTVWARSGNTGGNVRQQRDVLEAQQVAVQAARNANAVKQTAVYDGIPPAVRNNTAFNWFFEYDKDQDAQLSMMEYVDGYGGTWTEGIASEFRSLDRNGDGLVTVDEALTTIKEWDELRVKEEREKAAAAGPPGSPPTATGRRSAPTGTQNARTPATNPNQVRQPSPGRNQGDQQSSGGRSGRGRGGSSP